MHWFLDPIQKHYADFEGRVGRQEFWMFVLLSFGLNIILEVVHIEILSMIVSLALVVPSLALGARRLHDTGRSGWWQLLVLIPVIGWIVLIVWCAEVTTPADNVYGAPAVPKEGTGVPQATPAAATPVAPTLATSTPEVGEPLPEQKS
jgi:uncharacterized membrane protein YhaH (DUF805 family)